MTFITLYWKQLSIAIIIAVLLGAIKIESLRLTHEQEQNKALQATIASYVSITNEQKQENERIDEGSKKATLITVTSYENKLKARDKYYANHPNNIITELHDGGVLQPTTNSSASSKTEVSDTSNGIDETTSYVPTVKDCTTTTIMLDSLQGWIIEQQKVYQ